MRKKKRKADKKGKGKTARNKRNTEDREPTVAMIAYMFGVLMCILEGGSNVKNSSCTHN